MEEGEQHVHTVCDDDFTKIRKRDSSVSVITSQLQSSSNFSGHNAKEDVQTSGCSDYPKAQKKSQKEEGKRKEKLQHSTYRSVQWSFVTNHFSLVSGSVRPE